MWTQKGAGTTYWIHGGKRDASDGKQITLYIYEFTAYEQPSLFLFVSAKHEDERSECVTVSAGATRCP